MTVFSTVAVADDPLLQFTGYSWERGLYAHRTVGLSPDEDHSASGPEAMEGESSRQMHAVGELTDAANPLVWNPLAFSVSWSMGGLELVSERRLGTTRISEFSSGRLTFYADSPVASPQYGTNPPNATSPAQFEDGFSIYLDGRLSEVRLTFDEARGVGSLRARVRFVGGDALGLIQNPGDWLLEGDLRRGSPSGYEFQVLATLVRDGNTTGVEPTSWATVKERFR